MSNLLFIFKRLFFNYFYYNSCGTQGMACCPYGWSAARGWDAVSGLGSIRNFAQNANFFTAV